MTPTSPTIASPRSSIGSEPSRSRLVSAVKLCRERDKQKCVLTQRSAIDVAHIYPFTLSHRNQRTQTLWDTLRHFWSEERVLAWEQAVLGPSGTEQVTSLMCLWASAHRMWGTAAFALKPLAVSDDKTEMTAVFYWLPKSLYARYAVLDDAPTVPDKIKCVQDENLVMVDSLERLDGRRIVSGDEMTFKTESPESHPLPSFEILEMQWFLTRAAALSGAAELLDDRDLHSDSEFGGEISVDDLDIYEK
ncbi:hypothetical protein BDW69DRAFT_70192 [Aspergillus filifer]